jgi:hypothetical protein
MSYVIWCKMGYFAYMHGSSAYRAASILYTIASWMFTGPRPAIAREPWVLLLPDGAGGCDGTDVYEG